jgi:hypothetical protein
MHLSRNHVIGLNTKSGADWTLSHPTNGKLDDHKQVRDMIHCEAHDVMQFTKIKMKICYHKKHQPLSLKIGDKVYIVLAKGTKTGYRLLDTISTKLSERIGSFTVIEAVGSNAYHLNIPKM